MLPKKQRKFTETGQVSCAGEILIMVSHSQAPAGATGMLWETMSHMGG